MSQHVNLKLWMKYVYKFTFIQHEVRRFLYLIILLVQILVDE